MSRLMMSIMILVTCPLGLCAQSNGNQVAEKIARRLKDSLSLSDAQYNAVYQVNLNLNGAKLQARQQYGGTDSLVRKIQVVENGRDSLYRNILTASQFILYQQKKRSLVNNNF